MNRKLLEYPILAMNGMSVRAQNAMLRIVAGPSSPLLIGDLANLSYSHFAKLSNCGRTTIREISEKLREMGVPGDSLESQLELIRRARLLPSPYDVVGEFTAQLSKLSDAARLEVMRNFCRSCGRVLNGETCHCENEE